MNLKQIRNLKYWFFFIIPSIPQSSKEFLWLIFCYNLVPSPWQNSSSRCRVSSDHQLLFQLQRWEILLGWCQIHCPQLLLHCQLKEICQQQLLPGQLRQLERWQLAASSAGNTVSDQTPWCEQEDRSCEQRLREHDPPLWTKIFQSKIFLIE